MIKMTYKHVDALARCRLLILPALQRFAEPRAKAEIEKDLELILQVRHYINELLIAPSLPFDKVAEP